VCDIAESCDGVSNTCPADAKSNAVCRPSAGDCDVAESCNGVSNVCPPDGFKSSTVECRASPEPCNVAEFCTGSSATCPPDTGAPDTDGDGVCDVLDDCPTTPDPTQADADGDGEGDECDPCTNTVPVIATKPRVKIGRLQTGPGDDTFSFKGEIIVPFPFSPPLDPLANGVRVVIDSGDSALPAIIDAEIPAGAFNGGTGAGWTVSGSGLAWSYVNSGAVVPFIQGIYKVSVKNKSSSLPGRIKFSVKGKSGSYQASGADLPVRGIFVLDPPVAKTNQCGETAYDVPPGICSFSPSGSTLKCK
jgi:hypothetical protein